MTPKETAAKIVNEMHDVITTGSLNDKVIKYPYAKKCALIAVEQLIDLSERVSSISGQWFDLTETGTPGPAEREWEFWKAVKQEIENI